MKRRVEDSEESSLESDDSLYLDTNFVTYSNSTGYGEVNSESTSETRKNALASQYGIGAKLMQKMGYTLGKGLGAHGQGILEPIEQQKRDKSSGLGSIRAEDVEIHLPLQKEQRRIHVIESEINELRSVLNMIADKSNLSELDITDFCLTLRHLGVWHSMNLSEIVEAAALSKFSKIPISLFVSPQNISILLLLKETLMPRRYLALMKSLWLRKAQAFLSDSVSEYTLHQALTALAGQLAELGSDILEPVLPLFIEYVCSQHTIVRTMLNDSINLLQRFTEVIPELGERILTSLTQKGKLTQQLSISEALNLSATLKSSQAVHVAEFYILGDLNSRWEMLQMWYETLKSENALAEALEKIIIPSWRDELLVLLKEGDLTVGWWSVWRQQLLINTSNATHWLLWGLNMINTSFDLGPSCNRLLQESLPCKKPLKIPCEESLQPSDLLRYATRNIPNLYLESLDGQSGRLMIGSLQFRWYAVDDVFYFAASDEKESPVSLEFVSNYLTQYATQNMHI